MKFNTKQFLLLFLATFLSMSAVGMVSNIFFNDMDIIIFLTCVIGMSSTVFIASKFVIKNDMKKSIKESLGFLVMMGIGFGVVLFLWK